MLFLYDADNKTRESKRCAVYADVVRAMCGSTAKPAAIHGLSRVITNIVTMMMLRPVGDHLRTMVLLSAA